VAYSLASQALAIVLEFVLEKAVSSSSSCQAAAVHASSALGSYRAPVQTASALNPSRGASEVQAAWALGGQPWAAATKALGHLVLVVVASQVLAAQVVLGSASVAQVTSQPSAKQACVAAKNRTRTLGDQAQLVAAQGPAASLVLVVEGCQAQVALALSQALALSMNRT